MSDDEPFFPRPSSKENPGYREPARRPTAMDSVIGDDDNNDAKKVGTPADKAPKAIERHFKKGPALVPMKDEDDDEELENVRDFWQRHSFFASYPRMVGAFLSVIGLLLALIAAFEKANLASSMRSHSRGLTKILVMTPPVLGIGLFLLIAGAPRDVRGRYPNWWTASMCMIAVLGVMLGFVLDR